MSTNGENSLDRDLHGRAAEAANGRRPTDLVARALEIAVATRPNDRAWALVRLAADLRALERHEEGLRVLDVAWSLSPTERAERAMLSCAIAIHCDRGHHAVAETLERQFAGHAIDLKLGLACLRLYTALVTLTGDEEHHARREFYRSAVESMEDDHDQPVAALS